MNARSGPENNFNANRYSTIFVLMFLKNRFNSFGINILNYVSIIVLSYVSVGLPLLRHGFYAQKSNFNSKHLVYSKPLIHKNLSSTLTISNRKPVLRKPLWLF